MSRLGRRTLIGAAIVVAGVGSVAAISQTVSGLDVQRVRRSAEGQRREQAEFAREVARRGSRMRAAAAEADAGARANRVRLGDVKGPHRPGANGIDLDQMLASSKDMARASRNTQPRFIAFASLSMPPAALKQMMRDVGGAGGIVVFRGFPNNSAKQFMAGIARVLDKGQALNGVGIDPRLFRAFEVSAVPTYVVASTDFKICDGFHCTTPLPPHDRLEGNVTPAYALETIAGGGGPGAAIARVYLSSLEKLRRR